MAIALASAALAAQTPATKPQARVVAKPVGSLAQIVRGIYFPNSNLIFDVQKNDPGAPKKKTESTDSATDMYGGAYSGWRSSRTPPLRSLTASICS